MIFETTNLYRITYTTMQDGTYFDCITQYIGTTKHHNFLIVKEFISNITGPEIDVSKNDERNKGITIFGKIEDYPEYML